MVVNTETVYDMHGGFMGDDWIDLSSLSVQAREAIMGVLKLEKELKDAEEVILFNTGK